MQAAATEQTHDEVRTFRAPTPRAALAAVKVAFGKEAVILSSREISGGLFRAKEIEVIARRAPAQQPEPAPHMPPPPAVAPVKSLRERTAERAAQEAADRANGAPTGKQALARARAQQAFAPPHPSPKPLPQRSKAAERARLGIEDPAPRAPRFASPRAEGRPAASSEGLRLIPPDHADDPVAARTKLLTKLIDRGIDDRLATGLLDDAFRQMGGRVDPMGRLSRTIRSMLTVGRAPWAFDPTGERSVIGLIGPTGAGKTTTIAKIAARAVVETGLKVSMVTIDTYRIGAIDQLTRYGELMGVPTYVARDQQSFADVMEHCSDMDLVLVDTAGRSPNERESIAHQAALLRSWPEIQLHLAIPAQTSPRQLSLIRERYCGIDPERVVVTKVDEAIGKGAVFNIASRVDAPLSCITDGQAVPEDIHAPSVSALVDWVVH